MRPFRLLLICLAAFASGAVSAQQTGNLSGSISDENGAGLPGATVTLTGAAGPARQVTNGTGQFLVQGLAPGSYRLKAHVEGFVDVTLPEPLAIAAGPNSITIRMSPLRE
jgi:Carboxypeptidase regulatory-like domain